MQPITFRETNMELSTACSGQSNIHLLNNVTRARSTVQLGWASQYLVKIPTLKKCIDDFVEE